MRHIAAVAYVLTALHLAAAAGCKRQGEQPSDESPTTESSSGTESTTESSSSRQNDSTSSRSSARDRSAERERMVRRQLAGRDIDDKRVLEAMRSVPRHRFVLDKWRARAYADTPLPIGHDQTISQPYIVAVMTQALQLEPDHKVLEIGTGSGYQAAVLAEIVDEIYSIEIVCELATRARETLESLEYDVHVKCGDGYKGWPAHAPFDRIIVTAAPDEIPDALVEQLAPGGRMVVPVGKHFQEMRVVEKKKNGEIEETELMDVRFVPMVHGDAG